MNSTDSTHQALARGATILTGNARAARRLQLDYGRRQTALNHTAWTTPPICDWRTWLHDLWQQWTFHHPESPILLTSLQEAELWKTAQGDDAHSVVSPESLAALAQQAYSLLCDFQTHPSRRHSWTEPDADRFRHWAHSFDRICAAGNWLSSSRLTEHLTAAAGNSELTLPACVFLTGFDRITPAQQSLLDALQARGIQVELHHPESPTAQVRSLVSASEQAEVETCAHWLRQQLQANPDARLLVLSTSIEKRRGEIDRAFRHILTPQTNLSPDAPSTRAVYEFTLGSPLATVPVIGVALLALRWLASALPQQEVTTLLLSGYLTGSEQERIACARTDTALREHTTLSPLIPLERALQFSPYPLPLPLRHNLQAAFEFASQNHFSTATRLPGSWTELSRIAIEKMAWPGSNTADSVQFQAQRRWEKLLDDLALLDISSQPIPFSKFLSLLSLHAQQTLFAPESLDAPIQIMGPLESAGQVFDAVWFLGATDEQWPSSGRPHPLLPIALQRDTHMPHASSEDDWQLAQSITQRVLASTALITFSRASQNKDGELRPSPIVTALTSEQFSPETVTNTPLPDHFLESWQDSSPIPFSSTAAPGGASLLRDQAACPFRAFATYRLRTGEIPEPDWGLTPIERGNLLHDVLRRFWSEDLPRRIANQTNLKQTIAEGALPSILQHHIDASFHHQLPLHTTETWLLAYLESEKRRLAALLTIWLTHEADRQPFTVEHCEQRLPNVTVGPLQLKLRADRIDQLPDGSRLIIDYKHKTTPISTSVWQGNRPDEPQLPLYAVYGNLENVSGLLFAQISAQKNGFIGRVRDARTQLFADLKDSNPLVKYPYQDFLHDQWMDTLSALAGQFANGEATIQPKLGVKTCQHCPLPQLCRIHEINENAERSLWEAEDEEEELEGEDA